LRNSKIKLAIVGLAVVCAIAFGATYGTVSLLSIYRSMKRSLLTDSAPVIPLPPPSTLSRNVPPLPALPAHSNGPSLSFSCSTSSPSFSTYGPLGNLPLDTCADWLNGKKRMEKDTISPDEEHLASIPNDGRAMLWRMRRRIWLLRKVRDWVKSRLSVLLYWRRG
jgi:hypothetical protein